MEWTTTLAPSQRRGVTGRTQSQLRDAVIKELRDRDLWHSYTAPLADALDIPYATADSWYARSDWPMDRFFWVIDTLQLPIEISVSHKETDS